MELKIRKIRLSNYAGISEFECTLDKFAVIQGMNAVGKTTLANAVFDVLSDKNIDGSAVSDNVVPHDADGNRIHHLNTERVLTVDIGEEEHELYKCTYEKWEKPRGKTEPEYRGLATTYKVNGFDKTKTEFNEWITDHIGKSEEIAFFLSPMPFLNTVRKSTNSGRELLSKLSGFSAEDFVSKNKEYAGVGNILKGETVENAVKKFRKDLSNQKKSLADAMANLEYETNRTVEDFDRELNEKAIAEFTERKKKASEQNSAYQASLESYAKAKEQLTKLIGKKTKMEMDAGENNRKNVSEAMRKWKEAENSLNALKKECNDFCRKEIPLQNEMMTAKYRLENMEGVEDRCPECGQVLPEDVRKRLAEEREREKKKLSARLEKLTADTENAKAKIKEYEKQAKALEKQVKALQAAYEASAEAPTPVPDSKEYDDICYQIKLFQKMEKPASEDYTAVIADCEKRIAGLKGVEEAHKRALADRERRITILNEAVRANGQACADIERTIDKLLNFSVEKNKALAESIQPYFGYIRWKFFDYTDDGNIYETCSMVVDGTDYFSGLNNGAKKIAEIDLLSGLQKMKGHTFPIIVDEASIIDPWRIPKDKANQIIIIARTDDDGIVIGKG